MTTNLNMTLAGTTLPLLATEVKKKDEHGNKVGTGKFWHCFRVDDRTSFGVTWDALAKTLPTSIVIDGATLPLEIVQQDESYTDRMTKKVKFRTTRHLQAKGAGTFESTTLGEPRAYSVTITDTGDDVWNITVKVNRGNGGGTASPVSKQARTASNAAKLAAFMASGA
jgi:hypothetical protein